MDSANNSAFQKIIFLFIGLLIGSMVAAGLFFFLQKNNNASYSNQSSNTLELTSPHDNLATSQKTISVSGKTKPNSTVTVSTGEKNTAIYTPDGNFSTNIDLIEGQNTISLSSFSGSETKTVSKTVLYLDEDLSNL